MKKLLINILSALTLFALTCTACTSAPGNASVSEAAPAAEAAPVSEATPSSYDVYRLINKGSNEFLYTTDLNEVDFLLESGIWTNDGVIWTSPASGIGVYRLYKPGGYHLYTSSQNEISELTGMYGWQMDNLNKPMFYSGGSQPIYRAYHFALALHFLTSSADEYKTFTDAGWTGEEVAFYALSAPERVAIAPPAAFTPPASNGITICIDPGHQRYGDSKQEPNGPGSSVKKARVTGGTSGRTTGVPEYQLTLDISLKLRDELASRGYNVVMTRETHDVNISNMERAQFANNAGADITIRIHANGSDNSSVNGALMLVPSPKNPYIASLASESSRLGSEVLNAYCAATGMSNKGVQANDTMTGINFCTQPVCILEMGFMSNSTDDTNMQNPAYQSKMVTGIADGVDNYFK